MSDTLIPDLFAQGTAPESDPAFVKSVAADIGRARLRSRLRALALPVGGVLMLSGALYVAAGAVQPVLAPLFQAAPQFMGVPMPVVAGVVAAASLSLGARRYVLLR